MELVLYLLLSLAFLKFLSSLFRKHVNLPPGPAPLPVIGNLLQIGNKPHKSLAELAKTHGPIISLKLGQITTVVVSSPQLAREVLQKQDLAFSNRFVPNAVHALDHHKYSVVFLPAEHRWRRLRKILNSNIFSRSRLDSHQSLRRKKVEELVSFVGQRCRDGVAVDIGSAVFATSINLLSNTIFSVDLTDLNNESAAKEFRDLVAKVMVEAGKPNLVDYFPFLAMFDPQGIRARMTRYFRIKHDVFGRMVDERIQLRKLPGENKSSYSRENDIVDILLNISEENGDLMDRTCILHLCMDLFGAGSDTTSSSVEWTMAELLRNPNILAKAKSELEEVVGKGKVIDEADIAHLPYLRAIVRENWRLHPPVPFLIPRKVATEVELCGYTVPKGAQVLVNVWATGRDPEVWLNANCFMPERFLGSEIDVQGQDFELIPFGAGRRICPGLPMAIRMVSVMVGSLINSFGWKVDGGIFPEDLDMEDKFGITLQKSQPLRAVPISV